MRQPITPGQFAGDGIPLLLRVVPFDGLNELQKRSK